MTRPFKREYRMVWNGDLKRTSGGLTRAGLKENANGDIVSKARSRHGERMARMNNLAAYQAPPFGPGGVRRYATKKKRSSKKKTVGWF